MGYHIGEIRILTKLQLHQVDLNLAVLDKHALFNHLSNYWLLFKRHGKTALSANMNGLLFITIVNEDKWIEVNLQR